ncbi:MAG: hypothetical protein AAB383_02460 [Patescibacteria group bacterium]
MKSPPSGPKPLGFGPKTFFGRYDLIDRMVARDLTSSELPAELRILMLGCATGETVIDLLARFDREIDRTRQRTKIKLVAADIDKTLIELAQRGEYEFNSYHPGWNSMLEFYKETPWLNRPGRNVLGVNWEALERKGHSIEYRCFDIDSGLENLMVEKPFDLIEIRNSHHENKNNDLANVLEVSHKDTLIAAGNFNDRQDYFRELIIPIIEDIGDPETLRFFSGLVPPIVPPHEEKEKWLGNVRFTNHFKQIMVVNGCKALESLGLRLAAHTKVSDENRKHIIQREPLLRALAQFTVVDRGMTWHTMETLRAFHHYADPVARTAVYSFHEFIKRDSIVPLYPLDGQFLE